MFQSARLKLTAWYLSIVIFITVIFSGVIYSIISHQIRELIRRQNERISRFKFIEPEDELSRFPRRPPVISTEDLHNQEYKLFYTLILSDLGIFLIAGVAGYFLAGRTLQPIQIMMDEQNQFISNASHELRTPIATLRAEMEGSLLEKHITDQRARDLISSNLEELGTLQNLTNNLLQLAKSNGVDDKKHFKKIKVHEVVAHAQKKVSIFAKKKDITIDNKIENTEINGDKDSLIELFVIFFDNAIKYSGAHKKITVFSEILPTSVKIFIKDEGVGIPENDLPHIFKRFYRADKSRSLVDGYGLGLSIAKKIVECHQGTITVSSIVGKGSQFTLQFPR